MNPNIKAVVCGWSSNHDEAVETLGRLFEMGYQVSVFDEVPEEGAGIMVYGGSEPLELMDTPIGAGIGRRRWEIREVVRAMQCAALFQSVELALEA